MQLFVANCTRQMQDFHYRVPNSASYRHQPIAVGHQERIHNDSLAASDIDQIVKQNEKYGFVRLSDAGRYRGFISMLYDIDRKIPANTIAQIMERNQDVLVTQGQKLRQKWAVATNTLVERHLKEVNSPATLENLEITVEEEEKSGDPMNRMQGEGILLTKDVSPGEEPSVSSRKFDRKSRPRRSAAG